ncbi:hypothetical protein METBIDRAFT_10026 [Metschnikowia bicuspidata var. bicuspidata NRRL YB-4993]|uniref:Nucleoporin protein Ndc1-Nup n=1 Tax=Metschnikowia bicuspidata var. bicuspidata NRRL YB-4993 TaxID=869754 RepID=A0A1A0HIG9_9ASCO|nr:hypothetical protein METBIDRAFT_10026 [Metschnikowia bicuspidata var. bicuspidata NRRL YB-4993]OBA23805.1 hypothetical protein METBIDRAFT_10026 [Metschnikowia bicuspidata var. bicuspidata NRRL YB-4993]
MNGQPQQRTMLYEACFRATSSRRARYVNKTCFLVAVLASIFLRIPYGRFWWNLLDSVYRVPMLFTALWLVQQARGRALEVEYSSAKSLAQHVAVNTVMSGRFYPLLAAFAASSGLFFAVFLPQTRLLTNYYVLAKEFRVKPAVNDAWVYFWFHGAFCAVVYSLQHVAFQRHRLPLAYGVSHVTPEKALFAKKAFILGNAVFFTAFCSLAAPVLYFFARPLLYRAGWPIFMACSLDTAMPPFHIGLATLANATYASLVLFLAWEFACHVHDTYLTIGCLDGKTAIGAKSPDPVATLLSGLRDVRPEHALVRATAFQELAYVASANDAYCVATRNAIFNGPSHRHVAWPAILDECSLVIRNTSSRINFRSASDMDALRNAEYLARDDAAISLSPKDQALFGNSHDSTSNDTTQFAVSATSSPLKASVAFEPAKQTGWTAALLKYRLGEAFVSAVWAPLNRHVRAMYGPTTARQKAQFEARTTAWKTRAKQLRGEFLASTVGVLFRTTAKRDAESRVLNPALYGNAVLALSGLLMHAVEEDRSSTVSSGHISTVFNLLERPIRSCANYTDVLPASVFRSPSEKLHLTAANAHVVAVLRDLTMGGFFQLCVKYNYKLNDLQLSSRAFKLAKWVIDASVAQQQEQEKTQMAMYL